MHFPFDTIKILGFEHKNRVMHFPFDTKNFPFDTKIYITPLFTKGCSLANSISNI